MELSHDTNLIPTFLSVYEIVSNFEVELNHATFNQKYILVFFSARQICKMYWIHPYFIASNSEKFATRVRQEEHH